MNDVTRNTDLTMEDMESLFNKTKKTVTEESAVENIEVGTNPLLEMQKEAGKGLVIVPTDDDDGPKIAGTGLTDERMEHVQETLSQMDEQIEKMNLVKITKQPKNGAEMAELMDNLDNLDIEELRRMKEEQERGEAGNIVKDDDLMGADISSATVLEGGDNKKELGSGFFEAKSNDEIGHKVSEENKEEDTSAEATKSDTVQIIIDKRNDNEGDTRVINFTPDEREKMKEATQLELIQIQTINIDTGKVIRPDENFTSKFTSVPRINSANSVSMTFVASKFRASLRGLTFGEYVDLALSNEITDVETLTKKVTIIYNAILNTSIGTFASFDDFCRNFAFRDVDLGTYALYMSTNPEKMETGLNCGLQTCKEHFKIAFRPRTLLRTSKLSKYFLQIMEECATADGEKAIALHNTSSIIEKKVIALPYSEIAIEVGLRSVFDMIHVVLPFINDVEEYINEKYPDDTNKVRTIITFVTNYISALYFKDDNGNYTIRMDDMKEMVEVLYNLPLMDYEIINSIIIQTDEDYTLQFGIENVVCPKCKTKTEFVKVDIDQEVFRAFQELGSTRIDKKSLPRL